jgi:alkanesulfonate monooxygenase SsuD/methylene tetrahydromethanopterin reductase-like flavin-dependent oxidoreductase (luciferase family)
MFTEDGPTFEGRHYRTRGARNVPRPVQPGGPPILVGGSGERRTLRLVAQYADMCNLFGDVATIRHKVDVLRAHCADVGRDPAQVTVSRLSTLILTDSDEQTKTMRETFARQAPERAAALNVGREKEILEQVDELTDAGVKYLIFNMPFARADGVRRAGELLAGR